MTGDGAVFKCVLCLCIKMQIKILNSIKAKSTLSSVMCSWHLCWDKWCFCEPQGVYIVLVRSQLLITAPGFNQSSRG